MGVKASDFFRLPPSLAAFVSHFPEDAYPWEWVRQIEAALQAWHFEEGSPRRLRPGLTPEIPHGVHIEGPVFFHPTAKFPPYAVVIGPVWLGPETVVRPGAVIRGNVIAGEGCILGNGSEYKNCLLLDRVETAHFNYVGDSVLGTRAHLGAGAVCSNVRLDRKAVVVRTPEENFDTGLRKLGAILGDGAEVGCNAVLNPGTLLGPRSMVMPTMAFGGYLPAGTIAKERTSLSQLPRLD